MATRRLAVDAYVGLMSGTSLDGISAAVVRFRKQGVSLRAELIAHVQRQYGALQRDELRAVMREGSARDYCRADFDLGAWLADAALEAIQRSGLKHRDIRAIGSHGHTLWHEPPHSTLQIGDTAVIAERTGIDTVGDFRVADVAAGGQGAPLVPIADAMLFSSSKWRALQNVGGIGNVTIVPPRGRLAGVRAFDTGPGVAITDAVVEKLYPGQRFDSDGKIARRGTAITAVVDALLEHPYFASPPPKSTGRELFDARYIKEFIARCRAAAGRPIHKSDVVATAVEFTARSIAVGIRRFVKEPLADVLVSGGGARHPVLMERLAALLAPRRVRAFDEVYFDGEAKEAVAFALLAKLCLDGVPGSVPTATGAKGPRILGKIQRATRSR